MVERLRTIAHLHLDAGVPLGDILDAPNNLRHLGRRFKGKDARQMEWKDNSANKSRQKKSDSKRVEIFGESDRPLASRRVQSKESTLSQMHTQSGGWLLRRQRLWASRRLLDAG